jgi:uncharacterized protein YqgQ
MITKEEYINAKKSLRRDKINTMLDGEKRVFKDDPRYKLIEEYELEQKYGSILPLAKSIAATTIGIDLIKVKPLFASKDDYIKAKKSLRKDKINTILDGEKRIFEDDERYEIIKDYEEHQGGPQIKLHYLDFGYGVTSSK